MITKYYSEDELLPLSGIQHFAFCERQWGLIHVESQWVENLRTAEGRLLHQRVDDPYFTESRGDVKTVRSVPLLSKALGLYGVADVVEIHRCSPREERGLKHRNAGAASGVRYYNVPMKLDKISEILSEPDIIKDRKLSGKKVRENGEKKTIYS